MKKLSHFCLFLGAILFAEEEKQPNIVIIICDDLDDSIEGMGGILKLSLRILIV